MLFTIQYTGRRLCALSVLLLFCLSSHAQDMQRPEAAPPEDPIQSQSSAEPLAPLPEGYGPIQLGMSADSVKSALSEDANSAQSLFGYRGERDVSLMPANGQPLIQTDGRQGSFFRACYFQFYNESLYIISLNLNPRKTDYYSVFSALRQKYGEPTMLNPQKSEWQSDGVILSLERPLVLKYIDRPVFEQLQEASLARESEAEQSHAEFLGGL